MKSLPNWFAVALVGSLFFAGCRKPEIGGSAANDPENEEVGISSVDPEAAEAEPNSVPADEPEPPEPETAAKSGEENPYPVDRTIRDPGGREIDVIILGRTEETVSFRRKFDDKEFDLALEKLSEED
ncbi:MAG: hypothetical protein HKN23_19005, partial [Verrucomicrobiales bacterium]|nr:hypothetical protein [Verrucomicrobiales bacterium]